MPDRTQHSTPVEAVKTFQEFIDTAVTSGR